MADESKPLTVAQFAQANRRIRIGSRRSGKSDAMARAVAKALLDGENVYVWNGPGIGLERVVGVPGYPDGRQLTDG